MNILIVEDNKKIAILLKAGLQKAGFTVDCSYDGETGKKQIEKSGSSYDLIVLDLMLPKVSGLEICKYIRSENLSLPIMILTAKSEIEDKITLLDSGADDYMTKPFSFNEFLARINALLRRPKDSLSTELKVGDLSLDVVNKKFMIKDKEIKLTLKEFRILEYLMRHPNQVIEREEIVNNIWNFNFSSFSNVVDVHIKNLRKKLEENNSEALETIRGVGYKIKD